MRASASAARFGKAARVGTTIPRMQAWRRRPVAWQGEASLPCNCNAMCLGAGSLIAQVVQDSEHEADRVAGRRSQCASKHKVLPLRPHSSISVAVLVVAAVGNVGNRQSSGTKMHKIRGSCRRVRLAILRHQAAPLKRLFSQSFP
jgi:hypothetical protein